MAASDALLQRPSIAAAADRDPEQPELESDKQAAPSSSSFAAIGKFFCVGLVWLTIALLVAGACRGSSIVPSITHPMVLMQQSSARA